jgi:hypothetical protein
VTNQPALHHGLKHTVYLHAQGFFYMECLCGWKTEIRKTRGGAAYELEEHLKKEIEKKES